MKKIFTFLLAIFLSNSYIFAMPMLDTSIDSEIRKKYNVDDLSLPPLPEIYSSKEYSEPAETETVKDIKPIQIKPLPSENVNRSATLKKGTKLKLRSLSSISDKTSVGTKVSFILLYPVSTTYMTIPSNTIFYGKVIKKHSPQIAGNGGLVAVKLNSVKINGQLYNIDAKVSKADSKHIYLNNIKGKRTYLSSMPKTLKWGRNYKNKMYKLTGKLAKDKSTMILCPFSAIFGTVGYAGNLILAPILAIKYRGKNISLKKGSVFVFKLTEDFIIY